MARYTSGKQGVIPRYDIASILVFNERIYEYGDKVKVEHNLFMIVSYFGNFAVYLLTYKYYIIWQIAWKI